MLMEIAHGDATGKRTGRNARLPLPHTECARTQAELQIPNQSSRSTQARKLKFRCFGHREPAYSRPQSHSNVDLAATGLCPGSKDSSPGTKWPAAQSKRSP